MEFLINDSNKREELEKARDESVERAHKAELLVAELQTKLAGGNKKCGCSSRCLVPPELRFTNTVSALLTELDCIHPEDKTKGESLVYNFKILLDLLKILLDLIKILLDVIKILLDLLKIFQLRFQKLYYS